MKRSRLTSERISLLAAELTMFSAPRTVGHADTFCEQLAGALTWHRDSCRNAQLARRVLQALASRRLRQCLALIAHQQALLQLAAEDCCDESLVLDSLVALSAAVENFELGPEASPQQRLALSACQIPEVRNRYAWLVRSGSIESTPGGLRLLRTTSRRIGAYSMFAVLVGWPSLLFSLLTVDGKLSADQFAVSVACSVVMAAWLTRGYFTELKSDERTVRDLNSRLKPHPAKPRPMANEQMQRGGTAQR